MESCKMKPLFDLVQSGNRVFIHGGAATPFRLIDKLIEEDQRSKLKQKNEEKNS